ncbi:MAG TPA: hypothetical protein VHM92_09990 [Allosphingosinicella sp.]|nr:hypothetical protein [Allosphingosinicella sp.]
MRLAFLLAAPLLLLSAAPAPPRNVAGTWDLIWQTRKGPSRRGYLVVVQQGAQLRAEIHGQGEVSAKGTIAGDAFTLRGSRYAVRYTIAGRVQGDRMAGSLKVLSVERRFTGQRRR